MKKSAMFYHPELSNLGEFEYGEGCVFHSHIWIGNGVKIGNRVKIQAFAFLPPGVEVEDDVFIGPGVIFTNDPIMDIVPQGEFIPTKTLVKRKARIGAGAKILAGITIGENAVVGMGAVVIEDVPDFTKVVGVPAKKI